MMPWLVVVLGYFLGAVPTAYIAGRLLNAGDIRLMGDGNVGAANAFRQLGPVTGVTVGSIDAGKGALAILVAQAFHLPPLMVLLAGTAAVLGHNWSLFIGFRGGRGESTVIGVLLVLVTLPMLILGLPALLTLIITRRVPLASTVLFAPLSLVCWWLKTPALLIGYSVALPCLLGLSHYWKTREVRHASRTVDP